jgi:hypothetical protein
MVPKIYYCVIGFRQIAVPEENIQEFDGENFIIKASEVYGIEITPLAHQKGTFPQMSLTLIPMKDVKFQYSLISELPQDDPVYKAVRSKITGIVH